MREVRGGIGLMAAVALDQERVDDLGAAATELWAGARSAGLLTRWLWDGVALAPPLIVEESDVREMIDLLEEGLEAVASRG